MIKQDKNPYMDKFVVGVDFGTATTGLALGKNGAVSPVSSIELQDKLYAVSQVCKLARENKAALIVIGLPLTELGKETGQSVEVRRFAKLIATRIGTPVRFVNEHGTTEEAEDKAIEDGLPRKVRRKVDSISAAIILKRFFADEGLD